MHSADADGLTLAQGYGRLWRTYVRRHWRSLLVAGLMTLIYAVTTALMVRATAWLVDAFDARDAGALAWAPAVILAITLPRGAALYAQKTLNIRTMTTIEADLQKAMYGALLSADLARMQQEPPASLGARFTADIGLVREVMDRGVNTVAAVATIIGAFTQMLLIDWVLTLGTMAIFLLAMTPINTIGARLKRLSRQAQAQIGQMTAKVNEGLGGARLAKTYRLESYLAETANESFDSLRGLKVKMMDQQARVEPMMEAFGGLALAGLVLFVGTRIANGTNSIGDFSGFLAGLAIASQPMRKIGAIFTLASQGLAALSRIYALLDVQNTVVDRPDARPLPRVSGALSFRDVHFAYPDGSMALRGIDLDIPAGQTVALVGRSGAGKSTVFNLIPRLYDATSGSVTLDGHDLREVTLASLRDQVALVSQDSVLLTDTIAANIGFGRPGASRAEIEDAARDAAAHEFISRLPNGFDTRLGEEGGSFSGGERQRLAIARAILRDAPVLLLDEPTSALDAESEAAIRGALKRLTAGRTTLVIAHRLSTILDSDLICAMDQGRIVERGTHAELLERNGLYADLYRLQFGKG
ncbi:ABC transporter ATP-binding protein [Paroceanicella profunda]|uniref:ABC transporter ATP-binding protein n=1 Tax=Paroceanicella profunda TaxID=2579971 RepID=A0A5B8FX44_9RHOB|nr:ABC transporter ATP-binding protein [Paroceanicella profunda]QDL93476.1 ABC transporter ATP-binding protein [Paroceanicella profunda]